MTELAIILRAAQLIAHNAHNCVSGPTSKQDHDLLGGFYAEYAEAYDDVVERAIGTGKGIDLIDVNTRAQAQAAASNVCAMTSSEIFVLLLTIEYQIQTTAAALDASVSYGTKNFLAQIADDSEHRGYLIGQRVK